LSLTVAYSFIVLPKFDLTAKDPLVMMRSLYDTLSGVRYQNHTLAKYTLS